MNSLLHPGKATPPADLRDPVRRAIEEDVGSGDVTAALVPAGEIAKARVISRDAAVICGQPWFDAVFTELDPSILVHWAVAEGADVLPDQLLCTLEGPARRLLTGERTALNFLQTLSGTATAVRRYVDAVVGTGAAITDTRRRQEPPHRPV
jgi:nicotinate-nucleotide pyrophosphorylase (carboxylating)